MMDIVHFWKYLSTVCAAALQSSHSIPLLIYWLWAFTSLGVIGCWPQGQREQKQKAEFRWQWGWLKERLWSASETAYFIIAGVSYTRVISVMGRKGWLVPTKHLIVIWTVGKSKSWVLSPTVFSGSSVEMLSNKG